MTESTPTSLPLTSTFGDAYTQSADGHFVGHDGFVVPRDFNEFYSRLPKLVRGFVRRRWPDAGESEIDSRESELLRFLNSANEKRGCKDRIQCFDPEHGYGASASRFLHYVNICLMCHRSSLSTGGKIDAAYQVAADYERAIPRP